MMIETASWNLKSANARSRSYSKWTSAECWLMRSKMSIKKIVSICNRALCSTATSEAPSTLIKRQTQQLRSTILWDRRVRHHKPDHSRPQTTLKPALVKSARVFASPSLTRCYAEGAAAALQVSMSCRQWFDEVSLENERKEQRPIQSKILNLRMLVGLTLWG